MPTKARKGTVAIQSVKGRLRLCWSHNGKRYFLSLVQKDTKINRAAAQLTASRIEEDIRTENFDPSLNKYRAGEQRRSRLGGIELFDRYIRHKEPSLKKITLNKYRAIRAVLIEQFREGEEIEVEGAISMIQHLRQRLATETIKGWLSVLNACWEWAIESGTVQDNPWKRARKTLPKSKTPRPKPFTEDEVKRIIELFRTDPRLKHYGDFVEFRLKVGARSGELAGLRWSHLSSDCSRIRISESIVRRERQSTKTGEEREFLLSPGIQNLLLRRRPANAKPDDLVFATVTGRAVCPTLFAQRYWKPALEKLNIPYRKPYTSRATFVSHALYKGMPPAEIEAVTGHSQKVMMQHYSGLIRQSKVPDLWD